MLRTHFPGRDAEPTLCLVNVERTAGIVDSAQQVPFALHLVVQNRTDATRYTPDGVALAYYNSDGDAFVLLPSLYEGKVPDGFDANAPALIVFEDNESETYYITHDYFPALLTAFRFIDRT